MKLATCNKFVAFVALQMMHYFVFKSISQNVIFVLQIIGEVSKKVAQIQNGTYVIFKKLFDNICCLLERRSDVFYLFLAGLGEFRIRDLNDEINKLLREKRHWEDRILELGGPDYKVTGSAEFNLWFNLFTSEVDRNL